MLIEFEYLKEFKCAESKCSNTCCGGWNICMDKEALERINQSSEPNIKDFFKDEFFSKQIKIKSNCKTSKHNIADKKTPCIFLDNDNLCEIQKRFDKTFLPHMCNTFPKRYVDFPDFKFVSGSFGCPEISKIVLFKNKIPKILINGNKKSKDDLNFLQVSDDNEDPKLYRDDYAVNGKKIVNLILSLFEKNESIKLVLKMVNQIGKEREIFESNPKKINEIFFFIFECLKYENNKEENRDLFQISFFKNLFGALSIEDLDVPIREIIQKDCEKLFNNNEESIMKFSKHRELYDGLLRKFPLFENNFFMNEILGKLHFFTNKSLSLEEMIGKTTLIFSITRFLFIVKQRPKQKNLQKNYSKILSQCSKCFDGINYKKILEIKKNIFTDLTKLF